MKTELYIQNKREQLQRTGYGVAETLIVIIIIGILALVAIQKYQRPTLEAKETALKAELLNIRQSIILFRTINGRCPNDLKELITAEFTLPYKGNFIKSKYLEPNSIDKDMNILDPFGLRYVYNPSDCSVHSQKPGFEHF